MPFAFPPSFFQRVDDSKLESVRQTQCKTFYEITSQRQNETVLSQTIGAIPSIAGRPVVMRFVNSRSPYVGRREDLIQCHAIVPASIIHDDVCLLLRRKSRTGK